MLTSLFASAIIFLNFEVKAAKRVFRCGILY